MPAMVLGDNAEQHMLPFKSRLLLRARHFPVSRNQRGDADGAISPAQPPY